MKGKIFKPATQLKDPILYPKVSGKIEDKFKQAYADMLVKSVMETTKLLTKFAKQNVHK